MQQQRKPESPRNLHVRPRKRMSADDLDSARPKIAKLDVTRQRPNATIVTTPTNERTENRPSSFADQYEILEHLGKGTFGNVTKCRKKGTDEIVAVKVLTRTATNENEQPSEMRALTRIHEDPSNAFYFVRAREWFVFEKRTCIVFEVLAKSLRAFLQENGPIPLSCVRAILGQLLGATSRLKSLGIVHSDLKPTNIMLVDPIGRPCRVKIIDFGSAFRVRSIRQNVSVQSRYYRAPEILLGLPFTEAIDMWSLGCVAAELYVGAPLFPGYTEYDQVLYICQTLGPFDSHALNVATKTSRFFERSPRSDDVWLLKRRDRYESEIGRTLGKLRPALRNLDDVLRCWPTSDVDGTASLAEKYDRIEFLDLLRRMLCCDGQLRVAPDNALSHSFMRLTHLRRYANCDVVRDSVRLLRTCRNDAPEEIVG